MRKVMVLLWLFFVVIVLFAFIEIQQVNHSINFIPCLIFEAIGFLIALWAIFGHMGKQSIKIGFFVPWLIYAVWYNLILNTFNWFFVQDMPQEKFIFWNLIILFVHFLITTPMYLMGKNK